MTDTPEREQPAEPDQAPTEETPVTDLPTQENPRAEMDDAVEEPAGPVTEALTASAATPGGLPVTPPAHAAHRPSVLERVRENRMGPLAVTLGVGLAVALLLAVLVPGSPNLYAYTVLGLLVTAAVGFTARYLAGDRGWEGIGTAFVSAAISLHVMAVTGTVHGSGPGAILEQLGAQGPGFDDALLAAFAVPAVSTGGVLAGLVAGIIAGWGRRVEHGAPSAPH